LAGEPNRPAQRTLIPKRYKHVNRRRALITTVATHVFYMGNDAEALSWYERTLALDPNRAVAWVNRGKVLEKLGKKSEAIGAYQKLLALAPNHASAAQARARLKELGALEELTQARIGVMGACS
jgi:tetratricopeptide (TPR) repeat protein